MLIPRSLNLGILELHFYGLVIALAILISWLLAKKRAAIYKISPAILDSSWVLLPLILGIVGGRLYHVIDKWEFYKDNLGAIFLVSNGGMGIFGAMAGIFLGFFIFAKVHKIALIQLLDLAAPSIILGQAIGRIGNYVNQEGFGPPTNLPWGVYIAKQNRPENFLYFEKFHPTFFYEAILELIFFFILLKLANKYKAPGQIFGFYLVFYGISRFIAEIFRIDTATIGVVKAAYLFSFGLFTAGLILIFRAKTRG